MAMHSVASGRSSRQLDVDDRPHQCVGSGCSSRLAAETLNLHPSGTEYIGIHDLALPMIESHGRGQWRGAPVARRVLVLSGCPRMCQRGRGAGGGTRAARARDLLRARRAGGRRRYASGPSHQRPDRSAGPESAEGAGRACRPRSRSLIHGRAKSFIGRQAGPLRANLDERPRAMQLSRQCEGG
jgi:hypothetical protein